MNHTDAKLLYTDPIDISQYGIVTHTIAVIVSLVVVVVTDIVY